MWVRAGMLLAAAILLASCASGSTSDDDRPVVLTTFTVMADLAQEVAGDHLRVESLTKVGAEVHGYEPTPSDLRRAASADLVIQHGAGLESWFEMFTRDLDVPHLEVSAGIDLMAIAGSDQLNPHAWMSPANAGTYAHTLADAFGDLAPEHRQDFVANAQALTQRMDALHEDILDRLAGVPNEARWLVTCEGAFSYLARDLGLNEQYLWPVNSDSQVVATAITRAIEVVETHNVPAVFCESTVSDATMQRVVDATDAKFGGVLYVDSLSGPEGPVPSYEALIRHTVDTIATALTEAS